jgi:hypothetical protein
MQPPEPWAALLDNLGSIECEEHILLLGRDGPDLMCALVHALSPIHRALFANGRLAVCVDPLPIMPDRVRRMLALHGFTAISVSRSANLHVVSAEVPAFNLRRHG